MVDVQVDDEEGLRFWRNVDEPPQALKSSCTMAFSAPLGICPERRSTTHNGVGGEGFVRQNYSFLRRGRDDGIGQLVCHKDEDGNEYAYYYASSIDDMA